MIAYDYDSNNILEYPIKSKTSLHIKDAYQKMRKFLCSRGLTPRTHVLDNECSKMLNGEIITSSHIALLPQHSLPDKARQAHIFPGLKKPLISIGTLCDNDCIAVFDEKG